MNKDCVKIDDVERIMYANMSQREGTCRVNTTIEDIKQLCTKMKSEYEIQQQTIKRVLEILHEEMLAKDASDIDVMLFKAVKHRCKEEFGLDS